MTTKSLWLTLALALVLVILATVRLTGATESPATKTTTQAIEAEKTLEVVWSFEVRIRLPFAKKETP